MKHSASIDRARIATPCPVSWEQMTGDDRVRFCDQCELHVYNISELTRIEAETLIASTEGRICARLYRRADGSVITKDCPVGLRALRMRVSKRRRQCLRRWLASRPRRSASKRRRNKRRLHASRK